MVLVAAGAGVLAYPFITNLYQHRLQSHLGHQLASPALRAKYRQRRLADGDSLTRVRIPAIGVDVVVVEGTSPSALRAGSGHYPETPLPCDVGNVGIAGHRTTYGKPFANIDRLKPGDTIELDTPIGGCVYRIVPAPAPYKAIDAGGAAFVVDKTETSVVDPTPDRELTLTSCHPKGSASHRIVIRAVWARAVTAA